MPIGATAIAAIKNVFSGGGGKLVDSVKGMIQEFHMSPEDKAKLEQALLETTNKHIEAMEQEMTKQLDVQVKEMDSARKREMDIATSEKAPLLNKIVTPVLALSIVGLAFVLFYMIMFKGISGVEKDILIYVLGALTGFVGMVLSYYFGSSIGSHQKQERLDKITQIKQ